MTLLLLLKLRSERCKGRPHKNLKPRKVSTVKRETES